MIVEIIKILQSDNFYGAGECTEIAKGKLQIVNSWKDAKEKIKRLRNGN